MINCFRIWKPRKRQLIKYLSLSVTEKSSLFKRLVKVVCL